MLPMEHKAGEGVIKINCKPLDSSELKKFDKTEKNQAAVLNNVSKGKVINSI